MSVRKDLDALIDWYEAHDPASGMRIAVSATRNTVRKFARCRRGAPLFYRGREIVPTRKTRRERDQPPTQQEMKQR